MPTCHAPYCRLSYAAPLMLHSQYMPAAAFRATLRFFDVVASLRHATATATQRDICQFATRIIRDTPRHGRLFRLSATCHMLIFATPCCYAYAATPLFCRCFSPARCYAAAADMLHAIIDRLHLHLRMIVTTTAAAAIHATLMPFFAIAPLLLMPPARCHDAAAFHADCCCHACHISPLLLR